MAEVNRRLELQAFGQPLVIRETPIPKAPANGAIVKILFCGVCHSDVHLWKTEASHIKLPLVLGHEMSGIVLEFGSEADNKNVSVGDNVIVYPWGNCLKCNYCMNDNNLCPLIQLDSDVNRSGMGTLGIFSDGGFQKYVSVPDTSMLLAVPETVSLDKACMLPCSALTAFSAVTSLRSAVEEGIRVNGKATIALVGAGGLGLWAIQLCKALYPDNVQICAVDISEDKLRDAREAGADVTVCWDKEPEGAAKAISTLRNECGRKVDASIDFTGFTESVSRLIQASETGATVTLVGLAGGSFPSVPMPLIIVKGIRIQGICAGNRAALRRVTQLYAEGKVKPPPVSFISLGEVNDALQNLLSGSVKGRMICQM